jgi:hypothetical protein
MSTSWSRADYQNRRADDVAAVIEEWLSREFANANPG